jgi:threonine/homoserine/homoserine lactone efflux protein
VSVTDLLPPSHLLVPFLIAGLALNLTPGPDMAFVALSGSRGGQRAGLAAAAGITFGCFGHILFAVIGLSALIAASQTAFAAVKWLGVAYLVYLSIQLVRQKTPITENGRRGVEFMPLRTFRQAAIINVLNPKVGIFFLAFLPQFVEPDIAAPWQQILALGLLFNLNGLIVNGLVGILSAAAARRVGANPVFARWSRWLAASVLSVLAIRLATSRQQ